MPLVSSSACKPKSGYRFRQGSQGALLREGIKVVIAGQPNAGKARYSTLAGAELYCHAIAGTTRDKADDPDRACLYMSSIPQVCVTATTRWSALALPVPGTRLQRPMPFCFCMT